MCVCSHICKYVYIFIHSMHIYPSSLAVLTLIISFVEMFEFFFPAGTKFGERKLEDLLKYSETCYFHDSLHT